MQSIEGSFFSKLRSVANAATHPHTLITDRFRRGGGGPSPRGPSSPPPTPPPEADAASPPAPDAPPDQPAQEQAPMMDLDPQAIAGFQFGPAMLSNLRRMVTPPGLHQAAQMAHHAQHRRGAWGGRGWGGQALRGHPQAGVHGVDCDVAGMPLFLKNLVSKFKAAKANRAAKQHIAKEKMCRALLAPPVRAVMDQSTRRHHHAASSGFGWDSFKRAAGVANKASKDRYGRLLISAVPYGATALEARDLANNALRSGDLNPEHLRAAGDLARRGRAGDDAALTKIAIIRQKAGGGDAAAEKALDTIKVAHVIQTGGRTRPGRQYGGGGGGHYRAGVAALMRNA